MIRLLTSWLVVGVLILSNLLACMPIGAAPAGSTYYVSTTGDDAHSGSIDAPWRTIAHAIVTVPDDNSMLVVRDGVYDECFQLKRRFSSSLLLKAEHRYKARWQCSTENSPVVYVVGAKGITFEGFEITRFTWSPNQLVILWKVRDRLAEDITFRDNILHDSVQNDVLRIGPGARNILVAGNMFYNQAGSDEHVDVNGATDVVIEDSIFFNDFAGSGRIDKKDTFSYIVIKDSLGASDGIIGSQRITVRRNVFLNWEGSRKDFVLVGEDKISTFEAMDVTIENNLMLGNGPDPMEAPITIRGSKNITVRANTIVGDQPSWYFGINSYIVGSNPQNDNINIHNNIWADPTGTMGSEFSCCDPSQTRSYTFDNNLFFNAGRPFPKSNDPFVRIEDDAHRVIGDPKLGSQSQGITVPRWNGTSFNGGYSTIRQAFVGLVNKYGALGAGSAALHRADPANMPADDILGNVRNEIDTMPDIGAYELGGFRLVVEPSFRHILTGESTHYTLTAVPGAATGFVTLTTSSVPPDIILDLKPTVIPVSGAAILSLTSTHVVSPLIPGLWVYVPVTATTSGFTNTTRALLLVGGTSSYMPVILKGSQ